MSVKIRCLRCAGFLNRENGFTLIELIAVLVLSGLIASIAGFGLSQVTQGYLFTKKNTETAQNGKLAMSRMVKELTNVTATPTIGGSAGNSTITFESQHTVSLKKNYQFWKNGTNKLTLKEGAANYTLAENVTSFTVSNADAPSIDIELKLEGAEGIISTFSARVLPRNL